MNVVALLCVALAQFLAGSGIFRLFKVKADALISFSVSMILGVAAISFVPPVLQLLHIPIKGNSVSAGIAVTALLGCIPHLLSIRQTRIGAFPRPKLYEIPFFTVFLLFIITSVFRCFYFPPSPRDILAGSELIAEFTIKEGTMVNSIYNVDLHTTNNQFKSPFLTSLQIIYKLFVCPFGSAWLSTLFISLIVFLYSMLKERLHGFIACTLLLLYFCIPDAFAYSYIILYDYSNMIFFFTGYYFLIKYLHSANRREFALSVLLLGIATYIRVETLVLVGLLALMPAYRSFRAKEPVSKILINGVLMVGVSAVFYLICMNVFVALFVPQKLDTTGQINKNLADISIFFTRMSAVNKDLIFSEKGIQVYGYFLYYFITLLIADLIFIRKFTSEGRMALYGIGVVYFGLIFMGYLLPLFDVMNTTKRGMFKALPLILLYMSNSGLITKLSAFLTKRETAIRNDVKPVVRAATTSPRNQTRKK